MRPPNASPVRTALPTAHFERNDINHCMRDYTNVRLTVSELYRPLALYRVRI
jgi:hypothetical protein